MEPLAKLLRSVNEMARKILLESIVQRGNEKSLGRRHSFHFLRLHSDILYKSVNFYFLHEIHNINPRANVLKIGIYVILIMKYFFQSVHDQNSAFRFK